MEQETIALLAFEALAKSVLILAAAAAVDRAWRQSSASQRQTLWSGALISVLLLPLTRMFEPMWHLSLKETSAQLTDFMLDRPEYHTTVSIPEITTSPAVKSSAYFPNWKRAAVFMWFAGAIWLLLHRFLGSIQLYKLRKATSPLENPLVKQLSGRIFKEFSICRPVEIRVSSDGIVPLTWGTFRPTLMLPAESLQWSAAELEAALRHEAAHIAHRDHFMRWLATLTCALFWPNPFVWLAARRMAAAQEEAADDGVLLGGANPKEYAALLLQIARSVSAREPAVRSTVAMASASHLERRVLAIFDTRRNRHRLSGRLLARAALSISIVLGLATAAQVPGHTETVPIALYKPDKPTPKTDNEPRADAPQLEVEAKFLGITNRSGNLPEFLKISGTADEHQILSRIPASEVGDFLKGLEKSKDVDILMAPKITVMSRQTATVESASEMRYATEWTKNNRAGDWEPVAFGAKNVGIRFSVTPEVNANGTISLLMSPEITEFEGFMDLDVAATGADSEKQEKPPEAAAPGGSKGLNGRRTQPVFHTHKMESQILTKSGDITLLDFGVHEERVTIDERVPMLAHLPLIGGLFKSTKQERLMRRTVILVTARLITGLEMAGMELGKPLPAAGGSAAPAVEVMSGNMVRDKDTGVIKATGDFTIKAGGAIIQTNSTEVHPPAAAPIPKQP